jgi:cytochrome P450
LQVDLLDVFHRLTFDNICSIVLGFDLNCLSIELPKVVYEKAFSQSQEAIFYRHFKPIFLWKLQKWLKIGVEKNITEYAKIVDQILYAKRKSKRKIQGQQQLNLLSALMNEIGDEQNLIDDKFLRDTVINLLVAGRDTISSCLTWFFWLVTTHPLIEAKILEEIK